jgi:hypothetical protein
MFSILSQPLLYNAYSNAISTFLTLSLIFEKFTCIGVYNRMLEVILLDLWLQTCPELL